MHLRARNLKTGEVRVAWEGARERDGSPIAQRKLLVLLVLLSPPKPINLPGQVIFMLYFSCSLSAISSKPPMP